MMVTSADELFNLGMTNYPTALFATRHFESVVIAAVAEVMKRRGEALKDAFGITILEGGGHLCWSPQIEALSKIPFSGWYAGCCRKYFIRTNSNGGGWLLSVGISFENNIGSCGLWLDPQSVSLRKKLLKIVDNSFGDDNLIKFKSNYFTEVLISRTMAEPPNIDKFEEGLEYLLERVTQLVKLLSTYDRDALQLPVSHAYSAP
jgi:hypothetical protein